MVRGWHGASVVVALVALAARAPDAATGAGGIALATRAFQPGELVVVTTTIGEPAPDHVSVTAFGTTTTAYPVRTGTWRAIVGIDLDQPPGPAPIVVTLQRSAGRGQTPVGPPTPTVWGQTPVGLPTASAEELIESVVVHAKRFPTRRLRVRPQFVNPPAALAERIAAEAAFLRDLYETSTPEPLWHTPFVRPVDQRSNSSFGTRSVFNGQPRSPHAGADFASPLGTPVRAPNAGRIVAARDLFFSGQTVIIDHGQRLFSLLAHLSSMDVREGEMVDAGARIGLVGATGRVTGPHLHWALRAAGARVDPLGALALLGTAE